MQLHHAMFRKSCMFLSCVQDTLPRSECCILRVCTRRVNADSASVQDLDHPVRADDWEQLNQGSSITHGPWACRRQIQEILSQSLLFTASILSGAHGTYSRLDRLQFASSLLSSKRQFSHAPPPSSLSDRSYGVAYSLPSLWPQSIMVAQYSQFGDAWSFGCSRGSMLSLSCLSLSCCKLVASLQEWLMRYRFLPFNHGRIEEAWAYGHFILLVEDVCQCSLDFPHDMILLGEYLT